MLLENAMSQGFFCLSHSESKVDGFWTSRQVKLKLKCLRKIDGSQRLQYCTLGKKTPDVQPNSNAQLPVLTAGRLVIL